LGHRLVCAGRETPDKSRGEKREERRKVEGKNLGGRKELENEKAQNTKTAKN